jgi:hypothetical protein
MRLGNNLVQLEFALLLAEDRGAERVCLPKKYMDGDITDAFDLPKCINIEAHHLGYGFDSSMSGTYFEPGSRRFHGLRHETAADQSRVLRKYALPHVKKAPHPTSSSGKRLTIHLRAEDVLGDHFGGVRNLQPPCKLYHEILRRNPKYTEVLAVTQVRWGNVHPCIPGLRKRLGSKFTSQNNSLVDDVNAVLSAQNLVVSRSSFSTGLAKMSSMVKELHVLPAEEIFGKWQERDCIPGVKHFLYNIPEFVDYTLLHKVEWTRSEKDIKELLHWMVNYSKPIPDAVQPSNCSGTLRAPKAI